MENNRNKIVWVWNTIWKTNPMTEDLFLQSARVSLEQYSVGPETADLANPIHQVLFCLMFCDHKHLPSEGNENLISRETPAGTGLLGDS